jgi:hypothetical protein
MINPSSRAARTKVLIHNNCCFQGSLVTHFFGGAVYRIWTQGFTLARQVIYHLSHSPAVFCVEYFQIGSQELLAQSQLWTLILLISASLIARIIGLSHQHLTVVTNISNYSITLWVALDIKIFNLTFLIVKCGLCFNIVSHFNFYCQLQAYTFSLFLVCCVCNMYELVV